MILGFGPLVVNMTAPWLFDEVFTHDGITDYHHLFLMAMGISLAAALLLGLGFHPPKNVGTDGETGH